MDLGARALAEAKAAGFAAAGLVRLGPTPARDLDRLAGFVDSGQAAGLSGWQGGLAGGGRADPRQLLDGARAALVVARSVGAERLEAPGLRGRVARHARGPNYHQLVGAALREVARRLGAGYRVCVDTTPLLERALAAAAGLGFVGRSTLLVVPGLGPAAVLGVLLVDVDLGETPAPAAAADPCGDCRRCLDACPGRALVAPRVLDARRCLSYWTTAAPAAIPEEMRPLIGDRLYGCDRCIESCPHHVPLPSAAADPDLLALFDHPPTATRLLRRTGLRWLNRRRLLRNAAVALGNLGDGGAAPTLERAARHPDALVAEHARWALGRLGR